MKLLRSRIAAGVLAVALLAAGGAVYWLKLRGTTPADLISYLPSTSSPMVYIDVSALRAGGVLAQLAGNKVEEEADYKSFVEQTGFDYRRDLDKVLVSFQDGGTYFVLSGHFDWEVLARYAERQGGSCKNDLCRMPGSRPERKISFYPLRRNLMAMAVSRDAYAASLITPHKHASPAPLPAEPVWLALPSAAIRKDALPAGTRAFASALEGAEWVTLSVGTRGDQFELLLHVLCRSAEDATTLTAQLDGAQNMLRKLISREKKTPNPNDLSGLLTSGTFRSEDRRVYGHWPLSHELVKAVTSGEM